FFVRSVIAQFANVIGQIGVIRCDGAGITKCSQVFSGVKTERGGVPQRPSEAGLICGALGLRGVFNYLQPMFVSDLQDWIHVRWLPVKVNRNDGFRTWRQDRLNPRRIQIVGPRVGLNWNWSCT